MPVQSDRIQSLPPYVFSVIGDRIQKMQAAGVDVLRLDIGSPDMPPPDVVVDTLAESARQAGNHGYSGYRGTPGFRKAMADHYRSRFSVDLDPQTQVLPVIGSKEAIVNLCLAYLGPGDVSLVPDVGYPSYAMGTRLAGGEIYWIPLDEKNHYKIDPRDIPAGMLERAKLLWVNYPNNPTGTMVDLDVYRSLVRFCQEHDILLVSDNPYMDVTFDGRVAPSALQASSGEYKNVIEFYSFSKSYNMAGWRLGAALGSREAIANLLTVKSNIDSGHFKPIYEAGVTALQTSQQWIDDRNLIYQQRRDMVMSALPHIGLTALTPDGSLYVWARVRERTVEDYIEQALSKAHVSLAPGIAYGPGGSQHIRISISVSTPKLEQALQQLQSWYTKG